MQKLISSWKKKAHQYQELKAQRGVTLLEIIIVLGIIGIIAAGVVVLAQRAFNAQDISNVVNNTNAVRVAMAEAYKDVGEYPDTADSSTLTKTNITTATNTSPIAVLVRMGKIDISEAFNGLSGDAFEIGNATLIATPQGGTAKNKGFYIVINGLETEQCRNLASQIGAQWDYVASGSAAAGAVASLATVNMAAANTATILKSTTADTLSPATISNAGFCGADVNGNTNALILGSK